MNQGQISNDGVVAGQRTSGSNDSPGALTIDELLDESRIGLERVDASELEREMAAGALAGADPGDRPDRRFPGVDRPAQPVGRGRRRM